MEIKNKKSFNNLIRSLSEEILDEEELYEITGTSATPGYLTPFAFRGKGKKDKKKNKEISTNSTDYELVKEALDEKDLVKITKLIKVVVGDIIRDIWLKRNAWNK